MKFSLAHVNNCRLAIFSRVAATSEALSIVRNGAVISVSIVLASPPVSI